MIKILIAAISLLSLMSTVYGQAIPGGYLPPGNYIASCVGVVMMPGPGGTVMLWAMCSNDNGQTVNAYLDNADNCNFVKNIDGVLTCTGGFR